MEKNSQQESSSTSSGLEGASSHGSEAKGVETVDMLVIFLSDHDIQQVEEYPADLPHQIGDVVSLPRFKGPTLERVHDHAVVLGTGLTIFEAKENAENYYRRLLKWDGDEAADEFSLERIILNALSQMAVHGSCEFSQEFSQEESQ